MKNMYNIVTEDIGVIIRSKMSLEFHVDLAIFCLRTISSTYLCPVLGQKTHIGDSFQSIECTVVSYNGKNMIYFIKQIILACLQMSIKLKI